MKYNTVIQVGKDGIRESLTYCIYFKCKLNFFKGQIPLCARAID